MSDDGALRGFSMMLAEIDEGVLLSDLNDEFQELIAMLTQHVIDHGGSPKGGLTLNVNVKFDSKTGVFEVSGDFKIKEPKRPRGGNIFWSTKENFLTRSNPRQQRLPFKDVNAARSVIDA